MTTTLPAEPDHDVDHERIVGIVFDLPPQQAILVSWLARGAIANTKQIAEYLGSKTLPKIIVSHARTKLKEYELDIQSRWGTGYWMNDEDRAVVNASVQKFLEGR